MSARFLLSLSFIFSLSSFISPALLPALRAEHTVFIGAPGSTASASDLSNAFRQLPSGGVIILRGPVHAGANFSATPHAARVTLTSLHNGTDYRPAGARLLLGDSFVLGGPAFFDNITLAAASDSSRVFCAGQPAVFGPGVACLPAPNGKFPSLVAAARDGNLSNLAVLGGEWHSLLGGSSGSSAGNLSVTIRGGRFHGPVCAAGSGPHKGNATLAIHGGEFLGGVAVLPDTPAAAFNGAASVTLNNGVFHNTVSASRNPSARFAGRFALTLNGGDFSRVSDVTGTRGLPGGSTSSLSAPDALLDRPNSGELAFANPLLPGADPWVFFHEGFYYATSTGGSQLSLRKAANLPDLPNASPRVIYKPAPGHPWSRNLWSPKIYHFSETEVGPENAGWWLYLSANDGSGRPSQGQRMFALRSLSNSPFGPYGEAAGKRVPHAATRVSALKNNGFNDRWCGGPKIIRHAGTLYAVFVSEVGDASSPRTGDRYQTINIDRLVNPWTLAGEAVVINRPTFPWEKHGAGPGKAGMYPEVVEGGVPVPSPDGSLCLLYAGSGYWTPHYAIGVMRLMDGGDPMNPAHWQKTARPIFKASADVLGPGNACCVPSPTGKSTWVIYHAYVGKKTRGVPRQLFAEPCVVANGTVTIGNGHPLPLGTPLKIEINPLPLRPKISAFSSPAN